MPPTALSDDPRELLDLIIERAEQLRAAGVQALEFGGVKIQLAPPAAPMVAVPAPPPEEGAEDDSWVSSMHMKWREASAESRGRK